MRPARDPFRIDSSAVERLRAYGAANASVETSSSDEPIVYALEIPARLDAVRPACAFVAEIMRRRGVDGASASVVELALFEACANVIEHSYHFDSTRRFHLDLLESEDRLTFQIVSGGDGLDPRRLTGVPPAALPVTHREGRGLGLPIIVRAMDEVHSEQEPDGTNRLILVKHLREAAVEA
ncbi:MAG: ATP-binding protein [bacterium]